MPIYEYRCGRCGRKTSLFKTSIAEAEAAQTGLRCENCSSPDLRRLLSLFRVNRPAPTEGDELYDFDHMTGGLDDDPREIEKWADQIRDEG